MDPVRRTHLARWCARVLGFGPAAGLALAASRGGLGAEPIETVTHVTGEWALRFLLLTLAVTPVRRLSGWSWLAPLRRTFGLFAFLYASLHLATYVALDHFFDWPTLIEDVFERPFVTLGFVAFLLLVPLAATSNRAAKRRLGRRWSQLHRLVYVAALLGVVHYGWGVKADLRGPLVAGAVLALLLGLRAWWWRRRAGAAGGPAQAQATAISRGPR